MRNVSDKRCRGNENTLLRSIRFFENRAVYGIMWKNPVERSRPRITMWRMRITCWVTQATNAHLHSGTFTAVPLQQCL
jgi:hypothetical protein